MPKLTRWFIKSAQGYLLLAFSLAVVLAVPPRLVPWLALGRFGPVYFHLFLVGWVTQMIFGVIYWMFPIISRESPRGRPLWGWFTYGTLNAGLLLRVIIEPLPAEVLARGWGWLLLLSASLQWGGVVIFVLLSWPRVRDRYRGE